MATTLLQPLQRALLALALAVPALAGAADAVVTRFEIPNQGAIQFPVPATWNASGLRAVAGAPPTITFTPKSGAPIKVLATPIPGPSHANAGAEQDSVRSTVQASMAEAQRQAVEPQLMLKQVSGKTASGYYFSATDRAPAAGEFKYMTQGMLRVGGIDVTFTILSNEGQAALHDEAMSMLKSAVHLPPK